MASDVVRVVVKSPSRPESVTLEGVRLGATVSELKDLIKLQYPGNPPPADQTLIFAGKVLKEGGLTVGQLVSKLEHADGGPYHFHLVVKQAQAGLPTSASPPRAPMPQYQPAFVPEQPPAAPVLQPTPSDTLHQVPQGPVGTREGSQAPGSADLPATSTLTQLLGQLGRGSASQPADVFPPPPPVPVLHAPGVAALPYTYMLHPVVASAYAAAYSAALAAGLAAQQHAARAAAPATAGTAQGGSDAPSSSRTPQVAPSHPHPPTGLAYREMEQVLTELEQEGADAGQRARESFEALVLQHHLQAAWAQAQQVIAAEHSARRQREGQHGAAAGPLPQPAQAQAGIYVWQQPGQPPQVVVRARRMAPPGPAGAPGVAVPAPAARQARARRRRTFVLHINLRGLLQLLVFCMVLYQHFTWRRFVLLALLAFAMWVTSLAPLRRFIASLQMPRPAVPAPPPAPAGPGRDGAGEPDAGPAPGPRPAPGDTPHPRPAYRGLLQEIAVVVVGFVTSLLPAWNWNPEDAAAFAAAQEMDAREQQQQQQQQAAQQVGRVQAGGAVRNGGRAEPEPQAPQPAAVADGQAHAHQD